LLATTREADRSCDATADGVSWTASMDVTLRKVA
jgi:hypothetical protein